MHKLKTTGIIVFVMLFSITLSSCSSSRKLKKKCKECPEFSINQSFQQKAAADYGWL